MYWECRYCERHAPYAVVKTEEGTFCMCGAEWKDAKVLVGEEEDIDFEDESFDEYYEDPDSYPCGCCRCCGCDCDIDDDIDGEQ